MARETLPSVKSPRCFSRPGLSHAATKSPGICLMTQDVDTAHQWTHLLMVSGFQLPQFMSLAFFRRFDGQWDKQSGQRPAPSKQVANKWYSLQQVYECINILSIVKCFEEWDTCESLYINAGQFSFVWIQNKEQQEGQRRINAFHILVRKKIQKFKRQESRWMKRFH